MQYRNNMIKPLALTAKTITVLVATMLLASCAHAPWDEPRAKTEPLEKDIEQIEALVKESPESTKLRKDLYVTKEKVTRDLMMLAEKAKLDGNLLEAQLYYERVLAYDPRSPLALNGIERLKVSGKNNEKLGDALKYKSSNQLQLAKKLVHDVLLETPHDPEAKALKGAIDTKIGSAGSKPPTLKTSSNKPVTLELRDANINVVFEALSRATGINFILDKDIRKDTKASVFVRKMPIEDAIDLVLSSNGLQKKTLSENTALIFPATARKLRDYRDLKIRSFYLTNTTAKQAGTMLKSVLKVKNLFIDERLNMLVIRDTPEVVRIAEKLIEANDIEAAEVVLDIEVLEVARNRLQELGIQYPTQLSVLVPSVTDAAGVTTTASSLTLESLKNINSSSIGVSPNPSARFRKTTGDVSLLSNPRIRVKNNETAKVVVGDKIPIISTTQLNNGGATESVTYQDVGLSLEVEPRITLDNFVNIKVGLEVSSLGDSFTTGQGNTVFRIGTRSANTVLRLKDGETQILAGLIQDNERKSANKLPGLGDFPILGRLFSNQTDERTKTEVVLAITPRVVGNLRLPSAEVSEYWSGTESLVTDKPSIVLPPSSSNGAGVRNRSSSRSVSPSARTRRSAVERLREQRRQRQEATGNAPTDLIPGESAPVPSAPTEPSATTAPASNANGRTDNTGTNNGGATARPRGIQIRVDPSKPVRF